MGTCEMSLRSSFWSRSSPFTYRSTFKLLLFAFTLKNKDFFVLTILNKLKRSWLALIWLGYSLTYCNSIRLNWKTFPPTGIFDKNILTCVRFACAQILLYRWNVTKYQDPQLGDLGLEISPITWGAFLDRPWKKQQQTFQLLKTTNLQANN